MNHSRNPDGWIEFSSLEVNEGITKAYAMGWRFPEHKGDEWSFRFCMYLAENRLAVNGMVKLMKTAVPRLIRRLRLNAAETIFVPVPSSEETSASKDRPNSIVARTCATAAGAKSVRDAITKEPHEQLHLYGEPSRDAVRREKILDSADFRCKRLDAKNVVLIDNFIVSGSTLSRNAQAIHEGNRDADIAVYGVAVSKFAYRRSRSSKKGQGISNDEIPEELDDLFKVGLHWPISTD